MCKHSKSSVDKLANRQRGLDARGNDPMATKRESSFAAEFIKNPPGDSLATTLNYLNGLPTKIGNRNITGTGPFTQKLNQLGPTPTGIDFANFFADPQNQFKGLMDEIGLPIQTSNKALDDKARNQPFFQNRGRVGPPRFRRQSMDSRHLGITTGADRTDDTKDVYSAQFFHAKGQFRAVTDSETVQKFQKSGAPFIAGASGTIQFVAMEMETRKPFADLDKAELQEREKVLAMLSVQHVAVGHHSMAECLLAAKVYGYFKNVPDPLTDYDGAMKAFEKHLGTLGMGGGKEPLSRASENEDKNKNQIRFEDRLAFVRSRLVRYADQIGPKRTAYIEEEITRATDAAKVGEFKRALTELGRVENLIRAQAALIEAKTKGNNHVLRPDELVQKMGAAPHAKKKSSAEYRAVMEALASYETSMKQLAGRKLDHDQAGLGFEELRAALATVEKAAKAYNDKYQDNNAEAQRRGVMTDLIAKLVTEKALLEQAERECDDHNLLEDLTIEQAIEYARFGIKIRSQAEPNILKESRIAGKKVLGSGGINTVMLIDYEEDDNYKAEQVAFKPEQEEITTHGNMLQEQGIDPKKPRFGKRNIASQKMSEAMGLGKMIPKAEFVTVDGRVGLAMQKAKGDPPIKRVKVAVPNAQDHPDLRAAYQAKEDGDPDWKSKIPAKNNFGMRYGYDDEAQRFTVEKLRASEAPFKAPPAEEEQVAAVQQQLINLQWLDALSGQVDRHAENYLIDSSTDPPTLVGIDNDFSFGKNRDTAQKSNNTLGLPPIVDQATYDNLMQMVQDWPEIAKTFVDELDDEEIRAAKARLDAVRDQLLQLEQDGMVVQSWDQKVKGRTITEILMDRGTGQTYFRRDAEYQEFIRQTQG